MPSPIAFTTTQPLLPHPLNRFRLPSRQLHRRAPILSLSPPSNQPRSATLYSNGAKLSLIRPNPSAATPSHVPRYIVCPVCSTAYLANALNAATVVSCPRCANTFDVLLEDLHIPFLATDAPTEVREEGKVVCEHMSKCPGCTVSARADEPPILQRAKAFFAQYGLKLPVYMGSTYEWRTHAKLAVRVLSSATEKKQLTLGLFQAKSHDILPIPRCVVHAPEINVAVKMVEDVLRHCNVRAYNEYNSSGDVRYALFTVHRPSRKVQVTLVWNAAHWKDSAPLSNIVANELWRRGAHLFHSLAYNWNTSSGNAIVCPERERFYHARGEKFLVESVMSVPIAFAPYTFRQANLDAFENLLLPKLVEYIPMRANMAEFCAGAGVIGLVALKHRKLKRLLASEINQAAKQAFWHAYKMLKSKVPTVANAQVEYRVGSDSDTVDIVQLDTDVIVMDPPRGGMSQDVLERIASPLRECRVQRVIYVSCGFDALQRDAKIIMGNGEWKLGAAHAFILFPGSDHVEVLAVFDRKNNRPHASVRRNNRDKNGRQGGYSEFMKGSKRRENRNARSASPQRKRNYERPS